MTDDDPLDDLDDLIDDDLADDVRGNGGAQADSTDQPEVGDADSPAATDERDERGAAGRAVTGVRNGGRWVGTTVAMGVLLPPKLVLSGIEGTVRGFTKVIPGAQRIWGGVIRAGYKGYYKASKADLITHVMKEGRLKQVPLTWNNDHHRFEDPDGNWWLSPGKNEHTLLGPGNTPCAWAASEATNLGTQVQAEVAEALDMGYGTRLFTDADVTFVTISEEDAAGAGGAQQAMADGGGLTQHMTVEHAGVLDDFVVPVDPLYRDDDGERVSGRLVSMEKYYETYPETVDSEEMKKQEDRGRLAEMDRGQAYKFAIKMMLIAALIIAIVYLGPDVLRLLFGSGGGGGGGGGGGLPFLTAALGV